jgi:HAMP domain-containing protein
MNTMDVINIINALVLIIGLPALFKVAFDVGRRLQTMDHLEGSIKELRVEVGSLKGTIDGPISSDIRDTKERVVALETKVNIMWDWLSRRMTLEPQK